MADTIQCNGSELADEALRTMVMTDPWPLARMAFALRRPAAFR